MTKILRNLVLKIMVIKMRQDDTFWHILIKLRLIIAGLYCLAKIGEKLHETELRRFSRNEGN